MSKPLPFLAIAALALAASGPGLAAQNYTVSPTRAVSNSGGTNAFPFTSSVVRRYMQIHSDLPVTPMAITAIGFRITPTTSTFTGYYALDFELFMGRSLPWDGCSFWFDRNWVSNSRAKVVARKKINFGPGVGASPGPSPWVPALELKLDAPHIRLPVNSFAWELLVYANVANGSIGSIDVHSCSSVAGTAAANGTGCKATGRTAPMTQSVICQDRAGSLLLMFSASDCPAGAPAVLVIGATNPNLPIPGLCTSLYSDLSLVIPIGAADAVGDLNRQGTAYYYNAANGVILVPNPGPLTFQSQIFCLDAGQPGLPLAATNGMSTTVPTADRSTAVAVTRLFNNTGGTTELQSACFNTSSVGYGCAIRLTH